MPCIFIESALRYGSSPVNLLHIFRRIFLRTPLEDWFWHLPPHELVISGVTAFSSTGIILKETLSLAYHLSNYNLLKAMFVKARFHMRAFKFKNKGPRDLLHCQIQKISYSLTGKSNSNVQDAVSKKTLSNRDTFVGSSTWYDK